MRIIPFILTALLTAGLIVVLDIQLQIGGSKTPRLGNFLSPQKGFWQNAEPIETQFNLNLTSDKLEGKVEVYMDERMVPRVYAQKVNDAYFVQGYLHAKFRLWQMEIQTHAASGRLSEIMGAKANGVDFLRRDKQFRRLGMVYAAEKSLKAMEADTLTKKAMDAYTAGVNMYISNLAEGQYPLEYKLLNYKPELWSNLKTALFLKYMSFDLAGYENDFEMTNARGIFTKEQFEKLYPYGQDSLDPIIPRGAQFKEPGLAVKKPAGVDSVYLQFKEAKTIVDSLIKPDKSNGSNNWAVGGAKTQSSRPILCNDPHLGLNLPSLWFEMQISTPAYNAYGVSFPGSPSIIIGFNDNCAFGFTNAMRDVRDYYEIKFKDASKKEYWFQGRWQPATIRDEVIKIKGAVADTEHIPMTVWGPTMYDASFPDPSGTGKAYACRWAAHDESNELRTFILLNYSKNYYDYQNAIATFSCPGQNMIFACRTGDIAIRQQGSFPAKWRRQGDFVMPGEDSSYAWQGTIPEEDNIIMHNPPRDFVSSANQLPYDTAYPYYLGGSYPPYRGFIINRELDRMSGITTDDMKALQTSNYNIFAEMARPVLLKYIDSTSLNTNAKKYYSLLQQWDLRNDAKSAGATVFAVLWDELMKAMYKDELGQTKLPVPWPDESTLLESLLKDSSYEFADDITTKDKVETVSDIMRIAMDSATAKLAGLEMRDALLWTKYKDSGIKHLLGLPSLSRLHLISGGGEFSVNAFKQYHGPSWRMVVELTNEVNAYGVYPGGQSGNPGSRYYDDFVDTWLAGKYFKLQLMPEELMKQQLKDLKGHMTFSKS
ncbi:MAG: penicillin acylase family protein [Filimonas sp.]|nr:penicillin acylase family protein [Filimonas sp.]